MTIPRAKLSGAHAGAAPNLSAATISGRIVHEVTSKLRERAADDLEQGHDRPDEPAFLDTSIGVGVDLVDVSDVERSIGELGDRYLRRIYTEQELVDCHGPDGLRLASVAARFAAKEAALKALRPVGARPPWLDFEVRRHLDGFCEMRWHGAAESLALARGVESTSVSLSHEAGVAVACVVIVFAPRARGVWHSKVENDVTLMNRQDGQPLRSGEFVQEGADRVLAVLSADARLPHDVSGLSVDDDLFQAGMTSHASVNVMLALEDEFEIEFPNEMLKKSTFESVRSILDSIEQLQVNGATR